MTLRWSQRAWEWLPLLAWMAIIFITSGQTKQELPSFGVWDYLVKKAGHFVAYGVLAWLAWRVTRGWQRPFLWAFVITAVYAVSDEFHQSFVPGRLGSAADVLIDCLGALTTLTLLFFARKLQSQSAQTRRAAEPGSPGA